MPSTLLPTGKHQTPKNDRRFVRLSNRLDDHALHAKVRATLTLAQHLMRNADVLFSPWTMHSLETALTEQGRIPDNQAAYDTFLEILAYLSRYQPRLMLDSPETLNDSIGNPEHRRLFENLIHDLAALPKVSIHPWPWVAPGNPCEKGCAHVYLRTERNASPIMRPDDPDLCCARCQICDIYLGDPENYPNLPLHPFNSVESSFPAKNGQRVARPEWLDPALWDAMLAHYPLQK